jgi:hypothetical protein
VQHLNHLVIALRGRRELLQFGFRRREVRFGLSEVFFEDPDTVLGLLETRLNLVEGTDGAIEALVMLWSALLVPLERHVL